MKKLLLTLFFSLFYIFSVQTQRPEKPNSAEIFEKIQKLNFLGSVLYVAAHPDDENTRLIAYMSNHVKARTAYLSMTRGDGGQNLIGPEIRELLGVIRTQELLAARGLDGGEQMFTRANDFGYSKHPDETFNIWNKEEVLSDVVWAIRKFKPDVIINRFNHRTPGSTHGHHTGSAMLSMEAFDMTNDPSVYSDQLQHVDTWQPKRLYFNTGWWFYGSPENFEKADKSNMLSLDIGVYYPLKGMSNNELASIASSQHLCQGFGRVTTRGSSQEYIEFLKGEKPSGEDLFEGIDTSWSRVKGGSEIGEILNKVETNFNFKDPSEHLPDLMKAYHLVSKLEDRHWRIQKLKELNAIIEACAGLYLEVSANAPTASQGSSVILFTEALSRNAEIDLISYSCSTQSASKEKAIKLKQNIRKNFEDTIQIDNNHKLSSPYWLNEKGTIGMYKVDEQLLKGTPESKSPVSVDFNLNIAGSPITITKDVIHRYSKPDKGELYRPFEVIPEVTAKILEKVFIFENDKQKDIEVLVRAGRDNIDGYVQIAYPQGWTVYPEKQKVSIANKGDEQKIVFTVIPPKFQSEGYITPMVNINEKFYTKELIEIDYTHIPFQTILQPSESKVVRLDIQKRGENIAYIEGAGDVVPESLTQIGYNVVKVKPEDITPENLSKFDAVVIGIRAYNVVEELKFKQKYLFDFVENGGNMIVQYNTSRGIKVDDIAPYNLKLSRDRVTEELAQVRLLNTDHELLSYPNRITETDFDGWVQERGLYFPNEWGPEFTPLLSINDKGEIPKEGGLLVARHGKGHYIYTGLSFFRELPAGVSGAYRLFANMLSIGKDNINLNKKLTD
jgi:LmbE family N-acetylglucosaminyl deacetylase